MDSTVPAHSRARMGRPSRAQNLEMELTARRGDAKRMVLEVAPLVHSLALRCSSWSEGMRLEGEVYASLLRFIRRMDSPLDL